MGLLKRRITMLVSVIALAGVATALAVSQPISDGKVELSVYFDSFESSIKRSLSFGVGGQISIAMYDWTVDSLAQEIKNAVTSNAQTRVQILLSSEGGGGKDETAVCVSLQGFSTRVEVRRKSNIHHKFAIIGQDLTLTGSPNWTKNSLEVEANNLVVIKSFEIANAFRKEFDRLWRNGAAKC